MDSPTDRADKNGVLLFACWLLVSGATLGSLFLSEIVESPPCSLCWYQRVFMYPLPIIVLMGLFPFDANVVRYALPLAVGGCCTNPRFDRPLVPDWRRCSMSRSG